MFFRIKLIMVVGGAMLAYFGVQEYRVSMGTSTEASNVTLTELETGDQLSNNHLLIGEHIADYAGCIYEYEEGSDKVTQAYYPILSADHPFFDELNKLYEKYPNPDEAPNEEWPSIDQFKVMVKTKRFKTVDSIPDGITTESSVQGLVINVVEGLDSEESKLLKQSFPVLNLDDVLILEEGRKPSSSLQSLGMIIGGGLLAAFGVLLFFVRRLTGG